jgi:hypothetical protein
VFREFKRSSTIQRLILARKPQRLFVRECTDGVQTFAIDLVG